jgi:GT2 family glycosyltransferase
MLAGLARRVSFPLTFTTHTHSGFRLARCRNEGVAASTADYLLFTDGDCLLPPDHLQQHLTARRPGRVVAGDCLRLSEAASTSITAEQLKDGRFPQQVTPRERRRRLLKGLRAKAYETLRISMRPRLTGNNIALFRQDFERINGFDEQFVGWGLEDHDLQYRLERVGVRPWSILLKTCVLHLWHPPAASFSRNGLGTANLQYFHRAAERPAFCQDGLVKPEHQPDIRLHAANTWSSAALPRRRAA